MDDRRCLINAHRRRHLSDQVADMSHCDRILDALRDGQFHTTHDLYIEVGPCILHSRISDLRAKGHNVEGRHVPGQTGANGYEYRLLPSVTYVDVPRVRREASPSPLEAAAPPVEQLTLDGVPLVVSVGPGYYDI